MKQYTKKLWGDIMTYFISGILSFVIAAILGKILIPVLHKFKFGQSIREEGPAWHQKKSGTPTMGGVIFIAASLIGAFAITRDIKCIGTLVCALLFGIIGFADDYIKIKKKRNLGLTAAQKFLAQLLCATAFMAMVYSRGENADIIIPFTDIRLENALWILPINVVLMVGIVNSVNLTDGLDGLASFISLTVALFFAVMAKMAGCEGVAVALSAIVGAVTGFLIYNKYPAKVFMGDTGSLFLGGVLSAAAVYLGFEIILIICGLVFICETASVMIQVTSFKLTGKRVFKMSPIHHHFEMCGWSEWKIVFWFTAITVLLCIAGFFAV